MRPPFARRQGFSLIEVVVVSAIFAVISVAIIAASLSGQRAVARQMTLQALQQKANTIVTDMVEDLRYATLNGSILAWYDDSSGLPAGHETAGAPLRESKWTTTSYANGATHASIRFMKSKGYGTGGITYTDFYSFRLVKGESSITDGVDNNNDGLIDEGYLEYGYVSTTNNALPTGYKFLGGSPGKTTATAGGFHDSSEGLIPYAGETGARAGFTIKLTQIGGSASANLLDITLTLKAKDLTNKIIETTAAGKVLVRD